MMWGYGSWGWAGWLMMSLVMLVFWGGLIFGGIALWRSAGRSERDHQQPGRPGPEQLLDERFARGELDAEEYRSRRELLQARH